MTPAQAEEWLAFIQASEQQRLHELAQWVSKTNGPLDELDSSVDSLDVIWLWFLDFISQDFGHLIPAGILSDEYVAFDRPSECGQLDYAAEALVAYVFQVLRRSNPDAEWRLFPDEDFPGVDMADRNQVGVSIGGLWIPTRVRTGILARRAYRGVPQARSEDRLRVTVTKGLPTAGPISLPGAPSRLREALDFNGPLVFPPRFAAQEALGTQPVEDAEPTPSSPPVSEHLDALALIHVSGRWEDERALPPLDEAELAEFLTNVDLVAPPQDLPGALKADDGQLVGFAGSLLIESFAAGGRLRSVAFEYVGDDPAAYEMLTYRLRAFTSGRQLQIVRADDGSPISP